jgi:hypothetical protein
VSIQGFAERKLLLLCDVITACKRIHNEEIRKERLAALKNRGVGEVVEPNAAASLVSASCEELYHWPALLLVGYIRIPSGG